MVYEVSWVYWDENDSELLANSEQFTTLTEATAEYEEKKQLFHLEHVRLVGILEEYSK